MDTLRRIMKLFFYTNSNPSGEIWCTPRIRAALSFFIIHLNILSYLFVSLLVIPLLWIPHACTHRGYSDHVSRSLFT